MKTQIVGYYQANKETKNYCVTEKDELIICGDFTTFPPKDDSFFYSLDFADVMKMMLYERQPFVFDRNAFENWQKLFYQFCVEAIASNADAFLHMSPDDFIRCELNFQKEHKHK